MHPPHSRPARSGRTGGGHGGVCGGGGMCAGGRPGRSGRTHNSKPSFQKRITCGLPGQAMPGGEHNEDDSTGICAPGAAHRAAFAPAGRHRVGLLRGGGICLLGEVLRQRFLAAGIETELAGTLTSCSLIALSAVLTTLGWYQKLAAGPGPGRWCPLPALPMRWSVRPSSSKRNGRVLGTGAKMFTHAGPVIVSARWRRWCTARCCG